MTSANGTPVANPRRPSAAFPCLARGALPPGPKARAAPAARAIRALLVGGLLASPLVALPGAAAPRLPDAPQESVPPPSAGGAARQAASPRGACLDAARRAELIHGLPQGLLVAIALSESGLHAHALSIRGRAHYPEDLATARRLLRAAGGAAMAGCMQVNAGVHARGSDWPLDAERSADWAGSVLRRWFVETGSWAKALRRWHGGSPAGSRQVICRVRAKLGVTAPGSDLLRDQACAGAEAARLRRNGEVLLEVAEMPGR